MSAPTTGTNSTRRDPQRGRSPTALIKQTASDWTKDKVPRLGAALAYYTVFSLPGILVIAVAVAGLAFGADAVQGQLKSQFADLLGDEGAKGVEEMLAAAQQPAKGAIATTIGLVVLLFGASGVFGQLQDALNTIWEVEP